MRNNSIDYAWIQISDLHIFDNTEWEVLKEAYKRLEYLEDIKFIVVTGDLHQYGDSYEKTENFLNSMMELFSLTKKDVFIVPGNHDSGKCELKEVITEFIENNVEKNHDCYREYFSKGKLVDCFAEYNEFIASFYGSSMESMYPHPEQVNVITWNKKLNIIHLNTAINCNGDNKLKQIIDIYKLSNIPKQINNKYPTIMIAHHPFESIHISHQNMLRRYITDLNVSAYLCGDLHKELYTPIMTYKRSGANIPCIVCAKGSPENLDNYSDLGCVIYVKNKEENEVEVFPYLWDDTKKNFEPCTKFNSDTGNLKFELLESDRSVDERKKKEKRRSNALTEGESIWLPDAEYATGKQARFGTFTETKIIHDFIKPESNYWGLSAVKGIGKTFVLQIKRSKISNNKKLCLPLGIKPASNNGWGTDTIHLSSKVDLSGLKEFDNVVTLWKYCIVVYAINQLINIKKRVDKKSVLAINNLEERLYKRLEEYLSEEKIDRDTFLFCTNEEYKNLDLIMKGVLVCKDWLKFISDDLENLILLQSRMEDILTLLNKESLVIMIDKVDQAIRQTKAEEPVSCDECKKRDKINTCDNPNKNEAFCLNDKTNCNSLCCYGCEKYETPYSNSNLRVYGKEVKKYEHINLWQYIQLGLVEAVEKVRREFSGIIEIYFTIRQEAFSCESGLWGENRKKLTNLTNDLWYTKEEQRDIFYDCIRCQQDEYLFDSKLIGQAGSEEETFVGIGQLCHPYARDLTETVFDSIYRHSFDRTRDIQEYGQMLTENIEKIRKCDSQLERGEEVKKLIEKHAAKLAFYDNGGEKSNNSSYYFEKNDLLPNFWAEPENFKKLIMMFTKNLLFGKEAMSICRKFNGIRGKCSKSCSQCPAQHHPFSMLFKLGMLGQIKTNHGWNKDAEQEFVHSKDVTYITGVQLINLNRDTIYILHPALTKSIEHLNVKVRHFSGFILGKELKVSQEKLEELKRDFNGLKNKEYEKKYFFDKE